MRRVLSAYGWMIGEAYKGRLPDAYDRKTGEWIATKIGEAYLDAHEGADDSETSSVWEDALKAAEHLEKVGIQG